MLKNIFCLFLVGTYIYALDVEMVDDTVEGKKKAKENAIAKDGKTIYKPVEANIIKPSKADIIKLTKPNIIYEAGKSVPSVVESNPSNVAKKKEESIFSDINKESNLSIEDIHTQKEKLKLSEEANKSKPINLELDEAN